MSSAKQVPATIWRSDGCETALKTHILALSHLRNKSTAILAEIGTWAAQNNNCRMTIGPDRSKVGYSAIRFGDEVRKAGGERYVSFEVNSEYAGIARSLVQFAGLGEFVEIRIGSCSDTLGEFVMEGRRDGEEVDVSFDVLFVDHAEELYLPDLNFCEKLGLVRRGSVVVADNAG